jgi:hypothetical protein
VTVERSLTLVSCVSILRNIKMEVVNEELPCM